MLTRGVDAECWRVRHRGQVKGRGSVVPGAEGREAPGGSGSRARERAWPAYAGRSVARQSAGSQQLCFPPPAAARRASRCYWPAQRFSGWGGGRAPRGGGKAGEPEVEASPGRATCASMDAAEVEFLAEKELVTIIPNFSLDKIYLIGVKARAWHLPQAGAGGTDNWERPGCRGFSGRRLALLRSLVSEGKPGRTRVPSPRGPAWTGWVPGDADGGGGTPVGRPRLPGVLRRPPHSASGGRAPVGCQVPPAPPREGRTGLPPAPP